MSIIKIKEFLIYKKNITTKEGEKVKLIINSRGTYISKVGECFRLKNDDKVQEISARKVEKLLITTSTAMSTDAIELAVENNIDIVFLKSTGRPFGRVWHSKMGSISTIRRKQLTLQEDTQGTKLVLGWIVHKMENQMEHLKELSINRRDKERKDMLDEAIKKIKVQIKNIKNLDYKSSIDEIRYSIQGHEGSASRVYFKVLSELLPKKYQFAGRSRNPAKDKFNCMLNYGYGILYSEVEKSCIIAGLDPYIGIMHVDNYNRKALVFDLIEMYRVYIEKIVFKLFSTKKIKNEQFDEIEGGFYLNKLGKELLIHEYNKEMEQKIKHNKRNIELQNIIQFDCHDIANKILKEIV